MQFIFMLFALVAVLVLPVMLAARMVGAERTSFGAALLAVFLQACLSILLQLFAHNPIFLVGVTIVGGCAIYAFALDTSLLKGLVISVLATIIAFFVVLLLAGTFAVMASAT
jgi:hypothetical protein